jgi:microcystin-dependent protein
MADYYLGETRLVAFNFAPKGWIMCNGQILSIQQNNALFALLGTFYGGNGVNTFGLPDLRGRVPIGYGTSRQMGSLSIGQVGGHENHTLTANELPAHTHLVNAASTATGSAPVANFLGGGGATAYNTAANLGAMNSAMVDSTGGGQPHNNQQPYLVMTWIISLTGIFPSRN